MTSVSDANGLAHTRLRACSTGNSGDVAVVTVSVGPSADAVQVEFGSNPLSCSVGVEPATIADGDDALVTATFVDELGNKVPDGVVVEFVESSAGARLRFLGAQPDTVDSMATATVEGVSPGAATVGVVVDLVGGADVTCSTTVQVIPPPSSVELRAQREPGSTSCDAAAVLVIGSVEFESLTPSSFDNGRAVLCAEVRDDGGAPVSGAAVVWSVSGGGCLDQVTSVSDANGLAHTRLRACATGNSGDVAVVTATAGAITGRVQVAFGGDLESCSVEVDPISIAVGNEALVTATFVDQFGNKVPDGIVVEFAEISAGTLLRFLTAQPDTVNSVAVATVEGVSPGIAIVAAVVDLVGGADVTCSTAVEVTDNDGNDDGVPDADDTCPTLPGPPENDGCPRPCSLDATIIGTNQADTLVGTSGDDVIFGLGGNDTIQGNGGNDFVCAGAGNDRVTTAGGTDVIDGGAGHDQVAAGAGRDLIASGSGDDRVDAGAGDDDISAGSGSDRVDGGHGIDACDPGSGNDVLIGCEL